MFSGNGVITKLSRYFSTVLLALLALVAGFVGGVISQRLDIAGTPAHNTQLAGELVLPKGGLIFKSKEGKIVAKLDADQSGGFLTIYNASEKPAITVGGSQRGGGLIGLTNGKGVGDILRLTGDESGASLFLLSTGGKRGIELSTDADGGSLSINGSTGYPAVTIETIQSNRKVSGKIDVFESISGATLWSAPQPTVRKSRD